MSGGQLTEMVSFVGFTVQVWRKATGYSFCLEVRVGHAVA
jgi:hypothetical protein